MRSAFFILVLMLFGAAYAADMEAVGTAEAERKAVTEAESAAKQEADRKPVETQSSALSTNRLEATLYTTAGVSASPETHAACGAVPIDDAAAAQAIADKAKSDADIYAASPALLTLAGPESVAALTASHSSVDAVKVKSAYFSLVCLYLSEKGPREALQPVLTQVAQKLGVSYPATAAASTEAVEGGTPGPAGQDPAAAEREAKERAAKEAADREAAERAAAKETAEREAAQRAAKETAEREAAERAAKEAAEREAAERAAKAAAEQKSAEQSAPPAKVAVAEPPAAAPVAPESASPAPAASAPETAPAAAAPAAAPSAASEPAPVVTAPAAAPETAPVVAAPAPAPVVAVPAPAAPAPAAPALTDGAPSIAGGTPPAATPGSDGMLGEAECRALGVLGKCPDLNSVLAKLLERPLEYNHPKQMLLGKVTEISLVLRTDWEGKDLPTEVSDELKGLPGDVKQGLTKVTRVMSAELSGRSFEVSPAGRQERTVSPPEQVSWNWQVKPNETGTARPLKLRLYAHLQGPDGTMPPLLVKTLDATINVDVTTWDWIINQAQTLEPVYAIGAALIGLMTALMTFLISRRRREMYEGGPNGGESEPTTMRAGPVIGDLNQSAADSRVASPTTPAPAAPPPVVAPSAADKPSGTIPVDPDGGIEPKKD